MIAKFLKLVWLAFSLVLGSAIVAKLTLRNQGEPTAQEVDMVSVFEARTLISEAAPFYGGKILTLFGQTSLDLRKATPAPTGIHLDLIVAMGAVSLVVPIGWRVEWQGDIYGGGFDDATRTTADPDATVVRVTGRVYGGAFLATTKSPVEVLV